MPPSPLRRADDVLTDRGIIVVVEPWSLDRLEDGIGNLSARIDYSCSTSLCTPGSLGWSWRAPSRRDEQIRVEPPGRC
jgi:hypothetical protein